jgi:hypothetical protein
MDFYTDSGIPYSFDIEMPDLGDFGMLLPPSDIIDVSIFMDRRSKLVQF